MVPFILKVIFGKEKQMTSGLGRRRFRSLPSLKSSTTPRDLSNDYRVEDDVSRMNTWVWQGPCSDSALVTLAPCPPANHLADNYGTKCKQKGESKPRRDLRDRIYYLGKSPSERTLPHSSEVSLQPSLPSHPLPGTQLNLPTLTPTVSLGVPDHPGSRHITSGCDESEVSFQSGRTFLWPSRFWRIWPAFHSLDGELSSDQWFPPLPLHLLSTPSCYSTYLQFPQVEGRRQTCTCGLIF